MKRAIADGSLGVEDGGAGMILGGAGPLDALALNTLVGDTCVGGGHGPQLVE